MARFSLFQSFLALPFTAPPVFSFPVHRSLCRGERAREVKRKIRLGCLVFFRFPVMCARWNAGAQNTWESSQVENRIQLNYLVYKLLAVLAMY